MGEGEQIDNTSHGKSMRGEERGEKKRGEGKRVCSRVPRYIKITPIGDSTAAVGAGMDRGTKEMLNFV